jgi:hypothetical protein
MGMLRACVGRPPHRFWLNETLGDENGIPSTILVG